MKFPNNENENYLSKFKSLDIIYLKQLSTKNYFTSFTSNAYFSFMNECYLGTKQHKIYRMSRIRC